MLEFLREHAAMQPAPILTTFPAAAALVLSVCFALAAALHFAAPEFLRTMYRRGRYPEGFHRVAALWLTMTAVTLAHPLTRAWGAGLAGFLTFMAVVMLLAHGQYRYSVPGMIVLFALVPVVFAGAG
jgi:hypothetical protein